MPSFLPTQIGYLPTGVNGTAQTSTIVIGRFTSGTSPYEAVGLGAAGRPDYLQKMQVNLSDRESEGEGEDAVSTITQNAWINLDVADILALRAIEPLNPYFPSQINMTLKEVSICEMLDTGPHAGETVERKMMILASQTYITGVGGI